MIEVLIFPGYGIGHYPSFLFKSKNEIPTFPKDRVGEVVDKVKNAAIQMDYPNTKTLVDYLRKNRKTIVKSKDQDNMFYLWNEEAHWLEVMEIVSVDNSKLWTIEEYDGSEGISYPSIEIKDEDINYCEINI